MMLLDATAPEEMEIISCRLNKEQGYTIARCLMSKVMGQRANWIWSNGLDYMGIGLEVRWRLRGKETLVDSKQSLTVIGSL